ncbi:MAG TPA: hypothetical protein VLM88_05855 [Proteiniclasticum sp.]|nr:hypothetical protein [Proteiniclasticum sp.]
MKKILLSYLLIILALSVTGCIRSDYNHLLIEPRYDEAQYRSEIGNLFYETDEKIGITTSFGFFIYNLDTDELITTFAIDEKKAFGEEFLVEARLSKDEKSIILSGYSSTEVIDDYHYRYYLKSNTLLRVDQKVDHDELYPLPDQDRKTFETSDWTAQDLAYYPSNSDTPYYPFKNKK